MPSHASPHAAIAIDYRVIVALSLLLSLWLIAIDPVLDRDAILYLRTADAYLQDGFLASLRLFDRPLLSICLALLHQLTGLPLMYAGLLLNSLFYALFCVTFVAAVSALGGDRRVQLLAVIVVLSHPTLNDQRSSILRDPAYWAFILLAFRQLLLYAQQPTTGGMLRWYAYILLAALFRFEGLFFAACAPLALLATRDLPRRLQHCLRLLAPSLLALAATLAALLLYPDSFGRGGAYLPGISHYVQRLLAFSQQFGDLARAGGEILLDSFSREDAVAATLAGFGAIVALNIFRALTWPCLLLMLWQRPASIHLRHDNRLLLRAHIIICLLYLVAFTLLKHFMTERYATQLVVFLLLYLPFLLDGMWRVGARAPARYAALALLVFMAGDSLHNRDHEKAFMRDAAQWLQTHTPQQASLVSNNEYLAYFSQRQLDWKVATYVHFDLEKLLAVEKYWRGKDFLVMRVTRHNVTAWEAFLQRYSLEETMVFDGGRHGRVAIVKLPSTGEAGDEIQP
ncbi:MAG: hypothetical protein H6989_02135 [Pseudomonadales bacterium]|nr:hypothetical protein [Pseudomonadales bacterium]